METPQTPGIGIYHLDLGLVMAVSLLLLVQVISRASSCKKCQVDFLQVVLRLRPSPLVRPAQVRLGSAWLGMAQPGPAQIDPGQFT